MIFKKCKSIFLKLKIQAVFAFASTYMSSYLFIYKITIYVKSTSCGVVCPKQTITAL